MFSGGVTQKGIPMKKKILCIVLAVVLICGMGIGIVMTSGKCGENVTWRYNILTGTLTISGAGEMYDYVANPNYDNRPWKSFCNDIKMIVIKEDLTTIGDNVFASCDSLTNITIPYGLVSIGYGAFAYCDSLTNITIPNSVTLIDSMAFYNTACYNDTSNWKEDVLYIGNHLIRAKESVFGNYKIKDGTLTIAGSSFYNCTSLTSVTIPDSVTSIGEDSFNYCTQLTKICGTAGSYAEVWASENEFVFVVLSD